MSKLDITNRLAFLAEKFDVFESEKVMSSEDAIKEVVSSHSGETITNIDEVDYAVKSITTEKKSLELQDEGWETEEVYGDENTLIAIISTKLNGKGYPIIRVSIEYKIFTDMVGADPTPNKICLQWMLNTFTRFLKDKDFPEARRFALEDLPQANEYLTLFEGNKRKKKFREMAKYSLKGFKDITNINEYRNLSQLFDAVDPFIHRDPNDMESLMGTYIKAGKALVPFRDRRYTIYIPLEVEASTIFYNFTSWCTARVGNSNFNTYTKNYPRPNGDDSLLYIVIDNGFFRGENENMYQVHFESGQIHNRNNSSVDLYGEVLSKSEGVTNYFAEQLFGLAKEHTGSIDTNKYVDILMGFGFTEVLFDLYKPDTKIIRIDSETSMKRRRVPKLPDLSRFKNVTHFVIMDSSLRNIHPSIGSLKTLKNICLRGNDIRELPREIGQLKNLQFLNIWSNPIDTIPEEIKYLDKSMGGNLKKVAVNEEDIGEANYFRLKKLLPTVDWE